MGTKDNKRALKRVSGDVCLAGIQLGGDRPISTGGTNLRRCSNHWTFSSAKKENQPTKHISKTLLHLKSGREGSIAASSAVFSERSITSYDYVVPANTPASTSMNTRSLQSMNGNVHLSRKFENNNPPATGPSRDDEDFSSLRNCTPKESVVGSPDLIGIIPDLVTSTSLHNGSIMAHSQILSQHSTVPRTTSIQTLYTEPDLTKEEWKVSSNTATTASTLDQPLRHADTEATFSKACGLKQKLSKCGSDSKKIISARSEGNESKDKESKDLGARTTSLGGRGDVAKHSGESITGNKFRFHKPKPQPKPRFIMTSSTRSETPISMTASSPCGFSSALYNLSTATRGESPPVQGVQRINIGGNPTYDENNNDVSTVVFNNTGDKKKEDIIALAAINEQENVGTTLANENAETAAKSSVKFVPDINPKATRLSSSIDSYSYSYRTPSYSYDTGSTSYSYDTDSRSYDTGSKSYSYNTGTSPQSPDSPCCETPYVQAEKGAIRFHLPGRIQHKTTIKVSHFPTDLDGKLTFNINPDGKNADNDDDKGCTEDKPLNPSPNNQWRPPPCPDPYAYYHYLNMQNFAANYYRYYGCPYS